MSLDTRIGEISQFLTPSPKRIQRRRTKGWKMPEGAIYVGRVAGSAGGMWGNPFRPGIPVSPSDTGWIVAPEHAQWVNGSGWQDFTPTDAAEAVAMYRTYVRRNIIGSWSMAHRARGDLAGRDLACWCPLDQPCHADVLLELANQ